MSDTKRVIAVIYALGLSTCVFPLFVVSPSVLGKTELSPWDLFNLLASGPAEAWFGPRTTFLWVGYALLVCGPLLLWLPQYLKPIYGYTIVALCTIWNGVNIRHYEITLALKRLAGWHGTVSSSSERFVLPALLLFLIFVLSIELKNRPEAQ